MFDYLRSLKWVDYFFLTLTDPRRLLNLISRHEGNPYLMGVIILAIVSGTDILAMSLLGNQSQFFYYKITYGWILYFLLLILNAVIVAALIDFFCQLRGHDGSVKNIINLVTISYFPHTLLLPIVFIFKVLNFAPLFFFVFFVFLIILWQAFIVAMGISEDHKVNFVEALVMVLLPFISVGIIGFFSLLLMIINFFGYFASM